MKILHERWDAETNEPVPEVDKLEDWHRMRRMREEEVIRSYKVNPGTLNSEVADMLIARGVANKERVCEECNQIYKDNHHRKCNKCIKAQEHESLRIKNVYQRLKRKGV